MTHVHRIIAAALAVFACTPAFAQASLEVSGEVRFEAAHTENSRPVGWVEAAASVGLAEDFGRFVSVYGGVGVVYAAIPGQSWKYTWQSKIAGTRNVWGASALALIELHIPQEWVGISGGVSTRSFFMPTRSGVFRADAFAGVSASVPIHDTLDAFGIGIRYYFTILDDFKKVFGIFPTWNRVSMYCFWAF